MTVAASAPAVGLGSLTQPTPATRSSRFGSGVWMRRLRAEARSRDLGEAARELDTAGRGRSAARRELAAHSLGAAVPWRYQSQGTFPNTGPGRCASVYARSAAYLSRSSPPARR